MNETSTTPGQLYRPLYAQVKDNLVRRLIDGSWQPGQLIPSEFELAREAGVSQGTIRKALDAMTAENLLVRRQGRGTFVAVPEDSRILFRYFRIVPDSGEAVFPDSEVLAFKGETIAADDPACGALGLKAGDGVWRIERVRLLGGKRMMAETIILPAARFAGFDRHLPVPNNVYRLYSDVWGITIARANERLKAVAASAEDAEALGVRHGDPLLEVSRIACDLEGNAVEYRRSRCNTQTVSYQSDLR